MRLDEVVPPKSKWGGLTHEAVHAVNNPRESIIKPVQSERSFAYFAKHSVGLDFMHQIADIWVCNGHTDTRQVNKYYLGEKIIARFANDKDEKGRSMVFSSEFPALCHALLDKALAELRIEPVENLEKKA
jgi:hypothetical protein